MPLYVFSCSNCNYQFETLCSIKDKDTIRCEKCNRLAQQMITQCHILGPTSSKMDNFDYAAQSRFASAQDESRNAREEAVRKGISPYRNIDDISSGDNFNSENW